MSKKYAIQNTNGSWWNGNCWGPEQAREEYCVTSLPHYIDIQDDEDYLELWENSRKEPLDIFYTHSDDMEEILARVYEVK